ncbi:FAD-binding oxidoreductase [Desulfovibrio gilichinskyi]|uniref:Dihydroorotate oxidase B, electron transfer subunit n=1 Tax=Desulfovibrio gilichinskyi TaxID=1519643 RepID=A0A1X7CIW5_9BACT|nr:FAD-binding oxidoreductase [Desulfovibrio gilichinskyi]SME97484.1 dihydroorotate oxidase B, electron transfer subunit [Desulfovibrio gilichinskyi]
MSANNCRAVKVIDVKPLGHSSPDEEIIELKLEYPGWDSGWRVGQFVMIRPVSWPLDLIWGRPFSICNADDTTLTILFQVVGRGTKRLAKLTTGDNVNIWGPLGSFFSKPKDRPVLMLAGGMGIAPFCGYVDSHDQPENLKLFFAHRPPLENYPYNSISEKIEVEDIRERKPEDILNIIARIDELVKEYAEKKGLIVACGPTPFLRTVRCASIKYGVEAELSLENRMACGVGACLGCVTKDSTGHHTQVCTTGPIFKATDISLED